MSIPKKRLLMVDDDLPFRERLKAAMEKRGYQVHDAGDVDASLGILSAMEPEFALIDLRMPGESGLELVRRLKQSLPMVRIVVLTGYGSIATAMDAVRLGASDYLTKPADAEQIDAALRGCRVGESITAPSLDLVEWEHMQRILKDCENNISKAARVLGIERRTLQRKLAKNPPRF
jgi:two-component system response regulator RegA